MYKKVNNGGDDVEREEISAGNQGKVKELVLFSLFTALTAIGAFIRVPVPLCPFTLQLLFTTLSGLILGSRKGAASVAVYVALGLSGVPVFTQGGDFSEPVTQNTKRFVRCFLALDKSLAYARHYPAINWLTSYSEYIPDLTAWYETNVGPTFVQCRNEILNLLTMENRLNEIVKLIGSDVLPDDQKLVLEIARVIRLGFLQQNAFHKEDTYVPMEKQLRMMEIILHLYSRCKALIDRNMPMALLRESDIFEKIISIKYDVANDKLEQLNLYDDKIEEFYQHLMAENA